MSPLVALALALGSGTSLGAPRAADVQADWPGYVAAFVQADGRVIDRAGEDVSTSEGQAYALVRAVWCQDRPTFDRVLRWTRDNLQAGDPNRLPAWRWGRRPDGTWTVLDANPASDADQWLAWALLLGARAWNAPEYRAQAIALLDRIWESETSMAGPRRVLLPGPWEQSKPVLALNPSYWLTFAWRDFGAADPGHDWRGRIDDAYFLLEACRSASGLPPDWCWVDAANGRVVPPPPGEEARADFGFEAFRIGWTLAADLRWHAEPRARALLAPFAALVDRWGEGRPIPAVIHPDGTARHAWGYPGLYGALLPVWAELRPAQVETVFQTELRGTLPAAAARDYYAHNWVWFGMALWSGLARPEAR